MRYIIYNIDKEAVDNYKDEYGCSKNDIPLRLAEFEGNRLFSTNNKSELNNMVDFYFSRYASNLTYVMIYDSKDECWLDL